MGQLSQTWYCPSADVILYDATNYTGNTLCFIEYVQYGYDVDLAGIVRTTITCGGVPKNLYWYGATGCTGTLPNNRVRSMENPVTDILFWDGSNPGAQYAFFGSPYASINPGADKQYVNTW